MLAESGRDTTDCRILWRPITSKICVVQKNVIEAKLLKIKRSMRRGSYISFPDLYCFFFFINNYPVFLEFKN